MNTYKVTSSTTQYVGILFFLVAIAFLSLMIVVNQSYNLYLFIYCDFSINDSVGYLFKCCKYRD